MWEAQRIQGSLVADSRWSWGRSGQIVTISDCGLDTRAGMTGECMGGGSTSYCCSAGSCSLEGNQDDVPIEESWTCGRSGCCPNVM